jgi:hypothetical protein
MPKDTFAMLIALTSISIGFVLGYSFRPSLDRRNNRLVIIYLRRLLHQRDRRIASLENTLKKTNGNRR